MDKFIMLPSGDLVNREEILCVIQTGLLGQQSKIYFKNSGLETSLTVALAVKDIREALKQNGEKDGQ